MASTSRKRSPSVAESSPVEGQREKRQRLPTTCEWILHQPVYKSWKGSEDSASPVLWLHGPPGRGKTFLAQSIVEFLRQESTEQGKFVISHFCDATSTPSTVIRSILTQLLQHPALDEEAKENVLSSIAEPSSGDQSLPLDASHKLWETLSSVLPSLPNVILVLDGLDELPEKFLQPADFDLPSKLAKLSNANQDTRFIFSSRTHPSIRDAFANFPGLLVTEDLIKEDLERFIDSEISNFPSMEKRRDSVKKAVLEQSEGNFLWAGLSIKGLATSAVTSALSESEQDMSESLHNISPRLDDLYTSIISKQATVLTPNQISLRNKILQWLLFAVRPMQSNELGNAIAAQSNAYIQDINAEAIEACGSLIKIEKGFLKPVHHSLREYLLATTDQTAIVDRESSNLIIAKSLLAYLSHPSNSRLDESLDDAHFVRTHPLAEYATLYWVHHVSNAGPDPHLQEMIRKFFSSPTNCVVWADKLLPHFLPRSSLPIPPRPFNTARFFHLFALKGQLASWLPESEKTLFAKEVEDLLRTAYEGFLSQAQSKSGPESLEAVKRMEHLAQLYAWLPEHKSKGVALLQAASFVLSKTKDPSARQLGASVFQALADEYKRAGKYEDARKLLEDMLADQNQLPEDFSRMFALDSLGWVHMRLGDVNAAEPFLREATHLATRIYGSSSPMTLRPKVTLAEVLAKLGRHEEAAVFCAELKRQLNEHRVNGVPLPRDSISQLHTLGMILMQEGKFREAVDTYRVVVDDRKKLFGNMHGMTFGAEMQLGIAMQKSGDDEGARKVFEELLPRQKLLGEDHPDVKSVKEMLARTS